MDRLTTISASFFMAADVFAIISLATPDWIVTDVGGMYTVRINLCLSFLLVEMCV